MITIYVSIAKDGGAVEGMAPSLDTLPSTYRTVEVYAVRASPSAVDEARSMVAKSNPEGALRPLKRVAHSFTFVGNV